LLILVIGGVLGFTTLLCLGIIYMGTDAEWWTKATSGRMAWKEWKPWQPIFAILVGLGVMFASLLAVRSEERHNPTLRRLVYGFNAVLTGLLVMALIGVGNVMAFFYGAKSFDWTETSIYSITPTTVRILESLERPVKVHVLMTQGDPLYLDVRTLLETMQRYSSKFSVEHVTTRNAYMELYKNFELLDNTLILVVSETEEGKPIHQALRLEDLEDVQSRFQSEGQQRSFKGEQAVMNAIETLREGKVKKTIYFTQDSGELRLNEMSSSRRARGPESDRGMGALKEKLRRTTTCRSCSSGRSIRPRRARL
jgi:hypothetical protein